MSDKQTHKMEYDRVKSRKEYDRVTWKKKKTLFNLQGVLRGIRSYISLEAIEKKSRINNIKI